MPPPLSRGRGRGRGNFRGRGGGFGGGRGTSSSFGRGVRGGRGGGGGSGGGRGNRYRRFVREEPLYPPRRPLPAPKIDQTTGEVIEKSVPEPVTDFGSRQLFVRRLPASM